MSEPLGARAALEYVREHGVVLASAKGDVPRLIEAILGEPIHGNWWSHPKGSLVYNVLAEVSESTEVLVCRLIGGKVTLVHRRLWSSLFRIAGHFDSARLAQVTDEHTPSGRHVTREIAFPQWVPAEVRAAAARLTEQEAFAALGPVVSRAAGESAGGASPASKRRSRRLAK